MICITLDLVLKNVVNYNAYGLINLDEFEWG